MHTKDKGCGSLRGVGALFGEMVVGALVGEMVVLTHSLVIQRG